MAAPKPRKPDKRTLWPWRFWMTIGIGVVSSIHNKGDCLILASDRLGSFGDVFSTKSFGKMFCMNDVPLFAVCADAVQNAGELLPMIAEGWRNVPERTLQFLAGSLTESILQYKNHRFYIDVLPGYGIGPKDDWRLTANKMGVLRKVLKDWKAFSIQSELIIGTFDYQGRAHMYLVSSDCSIHLMTLNGFCAIGSGEFGAFFWLSYREQNLAMGVHRSAYHAYEAKIMSEQSPHVGKDDIMLLVATHQKYYVLSKEQPEVEGCPVSLSKLTEELGHFGPRSTESLEVL